MLSEAKNLASNARHRFDKSAYKLACGFVRCAHDDKQEQTRSRKFIREIRVHPWLLKNPAANLCLTIKSPPKNEISCEEGGDFHMLSWAFTFLVIAIIAALLGFTGVAGAAASVAKVLFGLFLLVCLVLFALAIFAGKKVL